MLADAVGPALFHAYDEARTPLLLGCSQRLSFANFQFCSKGKSLAQQVTLVMILRFVNVFMDKETPLHIARELPDPVYVLLQSLERSLKKKSCHHLTSSCDRVPTMDIATIEQEIFPWLCSTSVDLLFSRGPKGATLTSATLFFLSPSLLFHPFLSLLDLYDVHLTNDWTTEYMMNSFRRAKLESQLLTATPETCMPSMAQYIFACVHS